MSLKNEDGAYQIVLDKKKIPDSLKNKTGTFDFFLKNDGSNKTTYIRIEFTYVVSLTNVTSPIEVVVPIQNDTYPNETYGPK